MDRTSSFYLYVSTSWESLIQELLAATDCHCPSLDRFEFLHKLVGHLEVFINKGGSCDWHIAKNLCTKEPHVHELRIKIPGWENLLRIFYIKNEKHYYLTTFLIKPSLYEKQQEKEVERAYAEHIQLSRDRFKNLNSFAPIKAVFKTL